MPTNPPLRAVVLFEYPSLNGGENSWLAALPAIAAANIDVVAVAPSKGPLADRLASEGISIIPWAESATPITLDARRERLAEALQDCQPQLVHANSLSMSRLLGPVSAKLGIPSIGHIRDIVRLSRQAVNDLNMIDRLLAVSHATRDWHISNGVHPQRVWVQYNGVDLTAFSPRPKSRTLHSQLDLREDCRLIGSMGQLGLRKGTEKVLESARLLADRYPDVHWVIAGERHSEKAEAVAFEANLHRLASESGLAGRVHFVGYVADVPNWMADLAMLVHTARQEPLGRVLLEASAMGIPVVATDVGGTAEVLGPTHDQMVMVDDIGALTNAIERLLDDRAGCADVARRLHRRATQAFDAIKRGLEWTEHYRDVATEA